MSDPTVPELLQRRCQAAPGRVALDGPDGSRTFDELWSSACVLAGAIAARLADDDGPQPVAVAATADRVELAGAVVAVMLAGHAPLILDPDAPDDLQREWYWAAGARLVVADRATAIAAHRRFGYGTVAVTNRLRAEPAAPLRSPRPHDPALLVPELHPEAGAVVHTLTHHDVVARAARDAQRVWLTDDDRLGLLVPLSAPAGARAFLAGLLAGAGTVLHDARTRGWSGLASWLAEEGVTVAALTPTLVALGAAEPATSLPDLRRLMLLGAVGIDNAIDNGIDNGIGAGAGARSDRRPGLAGIETVALDEGTGDGRAGDEGAPGADRPAAGAATDPPPDDELEATLTSLFQELLDVGPVDRDDDFFALGGHSLLAARLLVLLEQRTGRRLPMAVFLEATTVAQLAAALGTQAGAATAAPVVTIQAGDPGRAPLFVTHDLQGSAWRFRDLARAVGEDQPVYGFESPMLEGRLRFATIEALAAHYVAAMRVVAPHGPYHLCGYSFGGILAFEMARVLEAEGDTVALLGVIDVGPGYRGLDYSRSRLPPLPYLRDAVARSSDGLPRWAAPLRRLWLNRWVLARRWRRVLRGGGTVAPEERLWFAWWAHWSLVGPDWAPSPYGGRVDLFWAETTAGTDASMGWGGHAREVCVHPVAGAHESLMAPPAVTTIGKGLRALLDRPEATIVPGRGRNVWRSTANGGAATTPEAGGPPPRRRRLPGPDLALLPLLRPLIALDARVVERAVPLTNQSVDPFDVPWAPSIAARWPTVRAELDQLLADGIAMPHVNDVHGGGQGAEGPWTTYVLFSFGRWISANAARCPATTALIADVPDLETAGFTVLAPSTHIPLHRGPFRSLRYQLGVRVPGPPGACRLQVGDEVIVWEDGKSLAFDDAVEHEAWNDADEPRYVLFIQTRWPLPGWRGRVHAAIHHLLARPVRDLPERVRRLDAALNRPG